MVFRVALPLNLSYCKYNILLRRRAAKRVLHNVDIILQVCNTACMFMNLGCM